MLALYAWANAAAGGASRRVWLSALQSTSFGRRERGLPFYPCRTDVLAYWQSFAQICWTCSRVISNDPELSTT